MTSADIPTGPVVVVGAGQAGAETAAVLRGQGFEGRITLIGDEGRYPYMRPPLSKHYLAGELTPDRILVRPEAFYERAGVELQLGNAATRIDRTAQQVELADGQQIGYAALVIATGGSPRRLAGLQGSNVHYLRTVADVDGLQNGLRAGSHLVIVGGGYVGLEVAALARARGVHVTVLEAADRLLARVACPELARFVHDRHVANGVEVRLAATVSGMSTSPSGRVSAVLLATGEAIASDTVLVGVGLLPNVGLAAEAGLEVADGIVVDEHCRTSDPNIYAVGDCTRHPCHETGGTRRLESVPNATEQARTVAAAIIGQDHPYRAVPWFWSDQGELKLKSVGLTTGCDMVVLRPQADATQFAAFYLEQGRLRAADIVNNPRLFAVSRRLVAARVTVSPEQLADPETSLDQLLEPVAG
ncbi:FAD-dependent oxidoreductase [Jatrophihabitans sp.]|uniref:NAD(P)/FAD-dependent oxidoreductase n=1 Tax=Jatrophihabitans sp. TaxID=1932789 RepID=UPI0030C6B368|nr:FAD-dependent pyridine nucleotide-disulfide oxidoreductase [Jatrophihabitans sp.]